MAGKSHEMPRSDRTAEGDRPDSGASLASINQMFSRRSETFTTKSRDGVSPRPPCALMSALLLLLLALPAAAGEADAIAISQIIQARHYPYAGIIDPIFTSSTSFQI